MNGLDNECVCEVQGWYVRRVPVELVILNDRSVQRQSRHCEPESFNFVQPLEGRGGPGDDMETRVSEEISVQIKKHTRMG
jgi:hypothetical protein